MPQSDPPQAENPAKQDSLPIFFCFHTILHVEYTIRKDGKGGICLWRKRNAR